MKESSFCELAVVFLLNTMKDLIIEEDKLQMEFQFLDMPTAHNFFKTLVLSKMKKDKLKGVDLKPFYAN